VASGGACFSIFALRYDYIDGFSDKRTRKSILRSHPACEDCTLGFFLGIRRAGATFTATVPRSRQYMLRYLPIIHFDRLGNELLPLYCLILINVTF